MEGRKKMSKVLIVLGVIVGVVAIISVVMAVQINKATRFIDEIVVEEVNLSGVADGEYIGECYPMALIGARVKVIVKDHMITQVELLDHKNGQGQAAEVLTEQVVQNQRVKLDAISGATVSSKMILKAVELALRQTK